MKLKIKKNKNFGEGGIHSHVNNPVNESEVIGGKHPHLFIINSGILSTAIDGEHTHDIKDKGIIESEKNKHVHFFQIQNSVHETESQLEKHIHERQIKGTTISGLHNHNLILQNKKIESLSPSSKELKTIQKFVNVNKNVNLKVESVIITSDKFTTLQEATQFVERKGFDGSRSDLISNGFKFRQLSNDKFIEETLKPFEFLEGVTLIVGVLKEETDNVSFDGMSDRVDLGENDQMLEPLTNDQIENLKLLKNEFSVILGELKLRMENFTPTLNSFAEITENLIKQNSFNKFLGEFINGFQILTDDLNKINLPEATLKSSMFTFENHAIGIYSMLKSASDIFVDSEGFSNFGVTLIYNEKSFEKLLSSLPLIQTETTEVKKNRKLIDWKTNDVLVGTLQSHLFELASVYKVDRAYVTIEYPTKKVIKYMIDNNSVIHAAYSDFGNDEDENYVSLAVKGKTFDAFIIQDIRGRENLIIYFDDESEIIKLLNPPEDYLNVKYGTYMLKETMAGFVLVPQINKNIVDPIFEENIIEKMNLDTDTFFQKREFYKESNMPHKRGIILYGSPGNGKSTFVKAYAAKQIEKFIILIDCENEFDSNTTNFLNKTLGDKPKVIVFEDMDSLLHNYNTRASVLNALDGIDTLDNTLFIATTNNLQFFDKAFLRPSRFDKLYKIDLPSLEMRKQFLLKYFSYLREPLLTKYAVKTESFSGAYFKELFTLKNIQNITIHDAIIELKKQLQLVENIHPNENVSKQIGGIVWYNKNEEGKQNVRIVKKEHVDEEEEFTIFGEVLIPEEIDAHEEIYSEKDVKNAAHYFMENFGNVGFMHKFFINGDVKILETFLAPTDLNFKSMLNKKRKVKKGTWLMRMRVLNNELWKNIKNGNLSGFSIGGLASVQQIQKKIRRIL